MIPSSTYYSVFKDGQVVYTASKGDCTRWANQHGGHKAGYTVGFTPAKARVS